MKLSLLALALMAGTALAGSATWNLNPTGSDWFTATNWTPNTIPNGSDDIATFDVSTATDLSAAGIAEVDGIVFNPGASAYTLTIPWYIGQPNYYMIISGTGIVNNSGVLQNFVSVEGDGFYFFNGATAGNLTIFTNVASSNLGRSGGYEQFFNTSNAGSGTFMNGGEAGGAGGITEFNDQSSAATATIINEGAPPGDVIGGAAYFLDEATAGTATFINNGGTVSGAGGGYIQLFDNSTCADATFINNGGTVAGAQGALTDFWGGTMGNATFIANGTLTGFGAGRIVCTFLFTTSTARIELFGTGTLDISNNSSLGRLIPVTVGSLEGDGLVSLGKNHLEVGSNNLSTVFSGLIQDGGKGGSFAKAGTASLTLTGANIYSGGTTIEGGKLVVNNRTGSATGTGAVQVNAGRLGGRGIIAGTVVVGEGIGSAAALAPGQRKGRQNTLTIQGGLTFNSDGIYECGVNTRSAVADEVVASGVTINGGRFLLRDPRGFALTPGTILTVIDNTSANTISGTFSNLADGGTISVGRNTYQADYEGGDGNDLTLTVVQ